MKRNSANPSPISGEVPQQRLICGGETPGSDDADETAAPSTSRALDVDAILRRGKKTIVPLDQILIDDRTYAVRRTTDVANDADAFEVDRGTVDLSGPHPVVLHRVDDHYQIVSGFRRLAVICEIERAKRVRALVLTGPTLYEIDSISARINLEHGKVLTNAELCRCFERDYRAHEAAGLSELSDRAWARIYHKSPTTIGAWRREMRGEGVQTGQSDEKSASPQRGVRDTLRDLAKCVIELCSDQKDEPLDDAGRRVLDECITELQQRRNGSNAEVAA